MYARPRGEGGTRAVVEPDDRSEHSRAVEDYLKAVYKLQRADESVATTALAGELGRSAASVTNMVKALADQGLLDHTPYYGVRLTPRGEIAARRIIRRHRVIETYLIDRLGYEWDSVHDEAERLEHAVSDGLVERMARALGDPATDPHGAPIPTREGEIESRELELLADLPTGVPAVVREVADNDGEQLRSLTALGLRLGTAVEVEQVSLEGVLTVRVAGSARALDRELALQVGVERGLKSTGNTNLHGE